MITIVDLKGIKLKDLTNKQLNIMFRTLLIEFQRFYPCLLYKCFILNTPLFFNSHWENEIVPHLSKGTLDKIHITGENSHSTLSEIVEGSKLPKMFGGECDCEATCVYSDKGPWTDIENKVNFQKPQSTKETEEFKFQEDEDDQIDLLKEQMGDLKNAIKMSK